MNTGTFRRSLLLGSALGASVGFAQAAQAQAVNANPTTISGSVVYSRDTTSTPGSETVEVQSQSAIIDWTPPSVLPPGPYVFLPDGNVLTFINGLDNPNFVVLNRILTLQPSRFDGTVISRLRATSDAPERPGGTVLFSSPGGIIVGPNALFDVGNLVLTTLNVVVDANNNFITPEGGFQFNAGEDFPNAAVITEPGAQIVATAENSYVAMVAPRVEHGGFVNVNGSAAYIAGEQLEFSVNQGLFDINIAVGSDNAFPIIHTGTTGGPASTGGSDNHGIYFAAVPKNQAITMLLEGSVGFDPATDASVENGVIVLSAGYDVAGGAIGPAQTTDPVANIAIADAAFTSDTVGAATGDIAVTSTEAEPTAFAGALDLDAEGRIDFISDGNAVIDFGEDLTLSAPTLDLDAVVAGGNIALDASGDIIVGTADAGDDFTAIAGGSFTGGTVTAEVGSDIIITAGGDLTLDNGAASGLILLTSSGGSVLSAGLLDAGVVLQATAAADIDLNNAVAGTDIDLDAGGDILVNFAQAGDDFTADAGGFFNGGTVIVTGAGFDNELISDNPGGPPDPLRGANIAVTANGDLRLDNGEAPDAIRLTSLTGNIFSDGTLRATGLTATAALNLDLNDVFVVEDLILTAANGFIDGNSFNSDGDIDLDASGTITLADADSGGDIDLTAVGDVRLDGGRAAGSITLVSTGGSVLSDGLPGGGGGDGIPVGSGLLSAGTDIIANAAVDVTLGDADAGDSILIDAGRNVDVRNLDAGEAVDISAAGNATFRGAVDAPDIAVDSADIDITASGALGSAGTGTVELTVRPTGSQTVLGGTAEGPGYTLTDAEADRIRAAQLRIGVPPNGNIANRAPDLIVRDLSLSATRTGTVEIVTPGIAQVEGELLLADAGAANGIDFTATQRLQIVTPTGAVRVRDAAGMTAGFLNLRSNNIWAASAAIVEQLLADPNFEGRDSALTVNTGPFNPRGHIEAGDVTLFARDTLFVQNSGGIVDFGGITVREDTLTIVPTGPQPLVAFGFGRRINPDGSFVTGNAFFAEVAFQQKGTGYTDDSQFNLCFINSGVCRLPDPLDPLPGGPDIVEEPVGGPNVGLPPDEDSVDTSFADDPLVDEPVTSGSDAELWDCDRDDDGDCDGDDRDE